MPDISDIRQAVDRIAPYAHRTPVLGSAFFNDRLRAKVFFKCENFQKVGAFKFRGACNAVFSLADDAATAGVATHSSGNHAQALALAARLRGIKAFIVMPRNAPAVKRQAVEGYGAEIIPCQPTLEARETTCQQVMDETGATLVHPYNDKRIIAGQGTAALELFDETDGLDYVLAPVGGGGLLAGTALAAAAISPETKTIAAEPAAADDAYRSFRAGHIIPSTDPTTIADGLRTSLGDLTFDVIHRHVHDIVTVSEDSIIAAMRHVWERMKIVIEPSAAVPVAALLEGRVDVEGRRVGVILSGGNVDLGNLPFQS